MILSTLSFILCNCNVIKDGGIFERNEGAIIGAVVSLIIVIISISGTYYCTILHYNNKSKNKYFGLLKIIKTELDWTKIELNILSKTLQLYKEYSIENQSFVSVISISKFDTSILENLLKDIIEYKKTNPRVVKYLISHIHLLKSINQNLDFSNANELLKPIIEISEIKEKISDFFYTLENEYIQKDKRTIKSIEDLIEEIIPKEKEAPKN